MERIITHPILGNVRVNFHFGTRFAAFLPDKAEDFDTDMDKLSLIICVDSPPARETALVNNIPCTFSMSAHSDVDGNLYPSGFRAYRIDKAYNDEAPKGASKKIYAACKEIAETVAKSAEDRLAAEKEFLTNVINAADEDIDQYNKKIRARAGVREIARKLLSQFG